VHGHDVQLVEPSGIILNKRKSWIIVGLLHVICGDYATITWFTKCGDFSFQFLLQFMKVGIFGESQRSVA
jgi:hypothetical protein